MDTRDMGKTILLTGAPRSGKTTLVEGLIRDLPCEAGGFLTRELSEHEQRVGFKICTLDGREATLAHVGIRGPIRVGKYGVDIAALDSVAASCIWQSITTGYPLIVIDEIGPMEIVSESFREAVRAAVSSDAMVLATIVKRSTPFTDQLKARPGVMLLEVTWANAQALAGQIREIIRSECGPQKGQGA
jgi:nucleoside-triphosphatase